VIRDSGCVWFDTEPVAPRRELARYLAPVIEVRGCATLSDQPAGTSAASDRIYTGPTSSP
jgi:hypothetical protein